MRLLLNKSEKVIITAILVVGFILRILFAIAIPSKELVSPSDSYFYDQVANNIVDGEGYHEGNLYAYRPPLYSFFLAAIYSIFGKISSSYYIVVTIQSVLSILTALILYKVSRNVLSTREAILSLTLFCFFPTLISLCAELMSETLFLFLFIAGYYLVSAGSEKNRVLKYFAGAVLLGLSALTREITIYFFPLLLIAFLIFKKNTLYKRVVTVAIMVVGFGGVLSPWLVRNYRLFKAPIVTTGGGINFYMGNNSNATGLFKWAIPPNTAWTGDIDASSMSEQELHNYELSFHKRCFSEGVKFIVSNPLHAAKLTALRLFYFWFPPLTDLKELSLSVTSFYKTIRFLYTLAIILFSIAGIFMVLRKRELNYSLILMWILYSTAFHTVVVVDHRYTLTIVPFLCILCSKAILKQTFFIKNRILS